MNKAELIERYGLEWYEQLKARCREHSKQRYHNDSEYRTYMNARSQDPAYREHMKTYCKERYRSNLEFREYKNAYSKVQNKARYVKDGRVDLIENYELAMKDNLEGWVIHHRLELHPDCSVRFTKQSLIKLDLYYSRPASELIWLRSSEHKRMHTQGIWIMRRAAELNNKE